MEPGFWRHKRCTDVDFQFLVVRPSGDGYKALTNYITRWPFNRPRLLNERPEWVFISKSELPNWKEIYTTRGVKH